MHTTPLPSHIAYPYLLSIQRQMQSHHNYPYLHHSPSPMHHLHGHGGMSPLGSPVSELSYADIVPPDTPPMAPSELGLSDAGYDEEDIRARASFHYSSRRGSLAPFLPPQSPAPRAMKVDVGVGDDDEVDLSVPSTPNTRERTSFFPLHTPPLTTGLVSVPEAGPSNRTRNLEQDDGLDTSALHPPGLLLPALSRQRDHAIGVGAASILLSGSNASGPPKPAAAADSLPFLAPPMGGTTSVRTLPPITQRPRSASR